MKVLLIAQQLRGLARLVLNDESVRSAQSQDKFADLITGIMAARYFQPAVLFLCTRCTSHPAFVVINYAPSCLLHDDQQFHVVGGANAGM